MRSGVNCLNSVDCTRLQQCFGPEGLWQAMFTKLDTPSSQTNPLRLVCYFTEISDNTTQPPKLGHVHVALTILLRLQ